MVTWWGPAPSMGCHARMSHVATMQKRVCHARMSHVAPKGSCITTLHGTSVHGTCRPCMVATWDMSAWHPLLPPPPIPTVSQLAEEVHQ